MRELIFLPGFSTAETVTNVSGRGVGMDVVKTNIESIGGTVDVDSEPGAGTTFRVKIPLTLAIIPAVTVECAGDRYAIPQVSLLELVRLGTGSGAQAIEDISGAPVYRLRGRLLPLVALHRGAGPVRRAAGRRRRRPSWSCRPTASSSACVVDRVLDTEEIVVKPLGRAAQAHRGVRRRHHPGRRPGRADPRRHGPGPHASVLTSHQARAELDALHTAVEGLEGEPQLVVGLGEGRRVAVPLSTVTRLEEFPLTTVEHVGGREVVQYRGKILPLLRLADHLGAFSQRRARPGLAAGRGLRRGRPQRRPGRRRRSSTSPTTRSRRAATSTSHGVLGSAVIQERVTELLDVQSAILAADPRFFDDATHPLDADDLVRHRHRRRCAHRHGRPRHDHLPRSPSTATCSASTSRRCRRSSGPRR